MQRTLKTIRREQRGSYVAQAAGIALLVIMLVAAMLGSLEGWQSRVRNGLRCYVAGFDTGGCGGSAPDGLGDASRSASPTVPAGGYDFPS